MEIDLKQIDKLSEEQFEALLSFIGDDSLKNGLLEASSSFPFTSKYYKGPKGNGAFWRGFREENIPILRVKKFYKDEIYEKKSKLDFSFFEDLLKNRISMIDNFDENYIFSLDSDLCFAFCTLYNIELTEEKKTHLNTIRQMNINNKKNFDEIVKKYEGKINELQLELQVQKNEYEAKVKLLSNENKNLVLNSENKKVELINKVIDNSNYVNLRNDLRNLNLESIDRIKEYLNLAFIENCKLISSNNYSELSKELTVQFILCKLMEEK